MLFVSLVFRPGVTSSEHMMSSARNRLIKQNAGRDGEIERVHPIRHRQSHNRIAQQSLSFAQTAPFIAHHKEQRPAVAGIAVIRSGGWRSSDHSTWMSFPPSRKRFRTRTYQLLMKDRSHARANAAWIKRISLTTNQHHTSRSDSGGRAKDRSKIAGRANIIEHNPNVLAFCMRRNERLPSLLSNNSDPLRLLMSAQLKKFFACYFDDRNTVQMPQREMRLRTVHHRAAHDNALNFGARVYGAVKVATSLCPKEMRARSRFAIEERMYESEMKSSPRRRSTNGTARDCLPLAILPVCEISLVHFLFALKTARIQGTRTDVRLTDRHL